MNASLKTAAYFEELGRQLKQLFELSKQGLKAPPEMKPRCEGYLRAAVVLGLASKTELRQHMEAIHQGVFGMSIAQRREQQQGRWQETEIDYSAYEPPAYVRNQPRHE